MALRATPPWRSPEHLNPVSRSRLAATVPRLPLSGPDERHRVQPDRRHAARHWAKLTMGVQALISLIVLGLIIARAVNILT